MGPTSCGRIYAQHVTADGQAVWATDGIPVTPEPSTVLGRPVIVSDGSGGAIVAWAGTLGARSGVFATVLAPSGETAGHDEIAVFAGSGVDDLRMVGMRNGGALLAWRVRDPAGDRILVQRLDREARLRHRAPVTACAAPGTRNHLALSADSRGGAYVAWSDDRPDFAIFATHLDENGAIAAGWPADGAPVAARRSGAAASIAVADVQLTSLGDVLPERGHTFGIRRGDLAPPARGRDGGAFLTWATDPNSCPRCEEQGPFVFVTRLDPAGPVVAPVLVATPDAEQNASLPVTSPRSAERPLRACSAGNDRIALSLPSSSPASLELFDLAGRRIWSREVESGAGAHTVRVGDGVPSGVYLARLRQGQATATARLAIVR